MKNNKNQILKKLADRYVYEKDRLTNEEYNMLAESSFYKHILYPRTSVFDTLVETAIVDDAQLNTKFSEHEHDGTSNPLDADREKVRKLIQDGIEVEFPGLNPHSKEYPDEESVNVDDLKEFIARWAYLHIHHKLTLSKIHSILSRNDTVEHIMHDLFSTAGI